MRSHRWLTRAAWLNAGTHAVASLGMVLLLRRGLPGPELFGESGNGPEWIHAHPVQWAVGWGLWTSAALAIVALSLVASRQKWARETPLRRWGAAGAAVCVVLAACADIFGQYSMVNAAFREPGLFPYLGLELGMFSSGVIGNTLYSVGLLLLSLVWLRAWRLRTRALAIAGGLIGLLLTPFACLGSVPIVTALLTGALFVVVIAWSVSLALEPAPAETTTDG